MLFNVPGSIAYADHQTAVRPSLWKYRYVLILLSLLGILICYQLAVVLLLRKSIVLSASSFQGSKIINPYQNWNGEGQEKISLHTHSNEVWFTPERHTVNEIHSEYKREGFANVAITDYGQVSELENSDYIRGMEWGQNLKKRHLLAIGIKKSFYDYFPIYASRENLSWVMDRMKKLGGYVIVSHPKLFDSFSRDELMAIDGFHAVEVYSPFGDDPKVLDSLLGQGRNVHCMASDDLHYFPETSIKKFDQPFWKDLIQTLGNQRSRKGESFLRYIVTAEGIKDQSSVLTALNLGSFYCVKKFFQGAEDPKVPKVTVTKDNTIQLNSKERYLEIRFIGQRGEVLQVNPDTNKAEYSFQEKDAYVRLEMISLTGSILSNAIYRSN
ncbi:phosphoesterase [Leptospira sp. 2 VSF19]|uniref:Phosphoesterase n=1 Tax=Leptospira soteropolitanensis TaxID=2950025 RepID=A0AAW5VFG7_9LEPT|nr:phosphoesterase [Leptospira soteropolitanensis]MCW7493893.1 phosphoesterase [Leptospira soteropolitanensis]MCW7501487.1 phosphoesterase [Leptospira soteropolitanensis]MCW7523750.1 phosphoesterase [Leptospira soteropolitanensis]MCW7527614.1 phosphoesterase [Leptospira soteropolitanensis]MCW7531468.1 phosphoesterase [Leptospira soteropolitanensis]